MSERHPHHVVSELPPPDWVDEFRPGWGGFCGESTRVSAAAHLAPDQVDDYLVGLEVLPGPLATDEGSRHLSMSSADARTLAARLLAAAKVADAAAGEGLPYLHLAARRSHWIATLLGRMPRALCGEVIPARSDIGPDAEHCPDCLERNGGRPGDYFVPRPRR